MEKVTVNRTESWRARKITLLWNCKNIETAKFGGSLTLFYLSGEICYRIVTQLVPALCIAVVW